MTRHDVRRVWCVLAAGVLAAGALCTAPALAAADPAKVLRLSMPASDDGFDLVRSSNAGSGLIANTLFDRLLTYDYLARPVTLRPDVAEAMPEVSEDGRVYTFRIRKGIHFTDDPVFDGRPRELTADDFAYTFKRIADPANRSWLLGFIAGKLEGLDDAIARARQSGRFDYDAPLAGVRALDRYTLQFRLLAPDHNFPTILADAGFGAHAREAVEFYGERYARHPVGYGAYQLRRYVPRSRIVLEANPRYRGVIWDFAAAAGDAADAALVKAMQGKTLPRIGVVDIAVIDEDQSAWLSFRRDELDVLALSPQLHMSAIQGGALLPELAARGVRLFRTDDPAVTYLSMNQRDPVIGGQALPRLALRRAIAMAYPVREDISVLRNGQARPAAMMVPPDVTGHDPRYRSSVGYDPELADRLLDRFGYRRGADGYRHAPDGTPLVLKMRTETTSASRMQAELWRKALDRVGLKVAFSSGIFTDNVKAAKNCELMLWVSSWKADYPDGDNFMQLLDSSNIGRSNSACYASPDYDALLQQTRVLPPGEERMAAFARMNRQLEADMPVYPLVSRMSNHLVGPRVIGFKPHPFISGFWKYIDLAPTHRDAERKGS